MTPIKKESIIAPEIAAKTFGKTPSAVAPLAVTRPEVKKKPMLLVTQYVHHKSNPSDAGGIPSKFVASHVAIINAIAETAKTRPAIVLVVKLSCCAALNFLNTCEIFTKAKIVSAIEVRIQMLQRTVAAAGDAG
jgi:hypothetical protein